MSKIDKELQNSLIQEWFNNLLENRINSSILLVEQTVQGDLEHILRKLNCEYESVNLYYKNIPYYKLKNIIVFYPYLMGEKNKQAKNRLLQQSQNNSFLLTPSPFDYKLFIENDKNMQPTKPLEDVGDKKYLYYLERLDPLDYIEDQNTDALIKFLEFTVPFKVEKFFLPESLDPLFNGTSLTKDNYIDCIYNEVTLFKEKQILTSRLAVLLYRVCTLDVLASTTKVGRYYANKTGSRSKVFKNVSPVGKDLHTKSFKAYDLSVNEKEMKVRKEIAMNLISEPKVNLELDEIAKITKLPLSELEDWLLPPSH